MSCYREKNYTQEYKQVKLRDTICKLAVHLNVFPSEYAHVTDYKTKNVVISRLFRERASLRAG
jgi:hypothetical protein